MTQDEELIYLSGGMQYAAQLGAGWRSELQKYLLDTYDIECFNPSEVDAGVWEMFGLTPDILQDEILEPEVEAQFLEMVRYMAFLDLDTLMQETSCMIVYWDNAAAKGAGTVGEITLYGYFRPEKPIYMVMGDGIRRHKIPSWVKVFVTEYFDTFDELKLFLSNRFVAVKKVAEEDGDASQ